jgi:hypothetical protein
MTISVRFESYNNKRYGRPWIAKVISWPVGSRATLDWGTFLGDSNGGEAEVIARPGDVVRYGQKDNKGYNSSAFWCIVQADGSLTVCTEPEAAKAHRTPRPEVK